MTKARLLPLVLLVLPCGCDGGDHETDSSTTTGSTTDPTTSSSPEDGPVLVDGAAGHPVAIDARTDSEGVSFVFWANRETSEAEVTVPGTIKSVPLDGGAVGSFESPLSPRDLVATPEAVLWTAAASTGEGALFARPTGGPIVQLLDGATQLDGIASAGDKVFWTEFLDPGRVYQGTLADDFTSFTVVEEIAKDNPYPTRIVADSRFAYWTTEGTFDQKNGAVLRADHTLAVPAKESLTTEPLAGPRAIALDVGEDGLAKDLYFGTLADGRLWRIRDAASATPGAPEIFAEGLSLPNGIAVDDKHVYISTRGDGSILYKPKDAPLAEAPAVLVTGQKNTGDLVVIEGTLIWINEGSAVGAALDGSIFKLDVTGL